ncbi:hypothetical protein HAX54_025659, partial [Datura stramonium]|nr:hypothetical protein [Datura stramonium]
EEEGDGEVFEVGAALMCSSMVRDKATTGFAWCLSTKTGGEGREGERWYAGGIVRRGSFDVNGGSVW